MHVAHLYNVVTVRTTGAFTIIASLAITTLSRGRRRREKKENNEKMAKEEETYSGERGERNRREQ
jgi:membrane protein implicated in regulation of membrane protease activity